MQADNEGVGFKGVGRDTPAVDSEESIGNCKGSALFAIDKRVVLREALPQCCRLFDEIGVIPRLRAI